MPPIKKKSVKTTKKKTVTKRPVSPVSEPITAVFYGPSGGGKTSLAGHFPRCGFICDSQEKGVKFLVRRNLIPKPIWMDFDFPSNMETQNGKLKTGGKEVWNRLIERIWRAASDPDIQTLVVESVTGIQNICFIHHCITQFGGDISNEGFFSFQKGPKAAAAFEWPDLIEALDAVHESGKHVIMTAHTKNKEEDTPEGHRVYKYKPFADDDIWTRLHRWASAVFFIGRKLEVTTRKGQKSKANVDVYDRLLYTEGTPYCDAKNWLGLEGIINLGETPADGFKALRHALGW